MRRPLLVAGARDRVLDAIPPASGAVVMGTGIVSVATLLDGHPTFSRALLALDGLIWLVLVVLLPSRALADRRRFRTDLGSPAALTSVAGTAVLGTRLALEGWTEIADALLAIALALWLGIVPWVLRHWRTPTVGVSFVLTVSTESLALLATVLAHFQHTFWLLYAALGFFALGLLFYAFVLSRFDVRQLAVGSGDHWVTGGALAISTVVAGRMVIAATAIGALGPDGRDLLTDVALALWAVTMAWLPLLLAAEALRRRPRYDVRRWSTVFPVGMYAACSFIVGQAADATPIHDFARGWVWVAVVVWATVFLMMIERSARTLFG